MTCNILVLFANDSEKLAMELINQFDNVPINYICVNNHSLQFSNLHEKTQAKIHVVFFSPGFLCFLENNVSDAYLLFGHLESKSSLAVFCLGLKVENVLCYHMAPLKSFLSWGKYEVLSTSDESPVFPKELMNRIHEVITEVNFAAKDIVVVPQFLKRHNNTIYVIFPCSIEGCRDLCIRLNEHEDLDISLKKVNPCVLKFSIPDSLFEFSHNVIVRIKYGDIVITDQAVHLSQDTPQNAEVNGTESTNNIHRKLFRRQELFLDEQIRYLKRISGLNSKDDTFSLNNESRRLKTQEPQAYMSESAKFDLKKLCKQYGLERLSFLMSHESSLSTDQDEEFTMQEGDVRKQIDEGKKILRYSRLVNDLPELDSLNRMNSFLGQEAGRHSIFSACRSLSLPSTLLPTSDVRNSYGGYLAMGGKEPTEMKPHERLLMDLKSCKHLERGESKEAENLHEDLMNSVSSGNYMTLMMSRDQEIDTRTLLKKGLSSSQQELLDLMQEFKEGECTMSYVEDQFQLWKERHCRNASEEEKRTRKTSALAMLWKKPKKKDLKVVIENKDTVNTNTDVKQEENPSVSASSASSKTSEKSLLTASSKGGSASSEQKSDDGTAPTGWVSSYSPTANRVFTPRYPKTEPPPLPSRPPPWSKMSTINKPMPISRKTLPNSAIDTTDVIEEERSPDLVEDSDGYYEEDEERNASMYELCQKYGLEKLGVCFVSGECQIKDGEALEREEMNDINRSRKLPGRPQDSDGYEIPIKKKVGSFESSSTSGSMRRSISLPSNLSQSYELIDDLLNSTEAEMPHHTENRQTACICGQCNESNDCFTNNFYMSLLEFRRENSADETSNFLSTSQQELLDLMYAFKRGEKTISQVEYQFMEWHSRHMGKCPRSFVLPYNMLPTKEPNFILPSIRKMLGKQKKKSVAENKFEYDLEKGGMKTSESTTTAQRLSKLSYTSTSSANSELSEISKVTIESAKSQEATAGLMPPICPKRPPPVPPKKPLYRQELLKSSPKLQAQTSTTSLPNMEQQKPTKKEKPIPPPKPKFILNLNSTGSSHSAVEQHKKIEEPRQDEEDNSNARASSPDYVSPIMHRRPKLQRQSNEIDCDQKFSTTPLNRQPFSPGMTNTSASRCRKTTEPSAAELPTQTLELLKKANLCSPDLTKPIFYLSRSNSDPSLRHSERREEPPPFQKRHIYLEILPPLDCDLQNQSTTVNQNTIVS